MLNCQLHSPDKCPVNWLKRSRLLTVIIGGCLGIMVYSNTSMLKALNVITYEVSVDTLDWMLFAGYAATGAVLLLLLNLFLKSRGIATELLNSALEPLLLYCFMLFVPIGFYTPLVAVLITGWSVFRLAVIWPVGKFNATISERTAIIIILAVFLLFTAYGLLLQIRSYNSLVLCHSDWGIFLNVTDNTLKGRWFLSNEVGYNFLGRHFIPGAVLLMLPYVALLRNVTAFFLMNSAVLFCCGPLLYLMARRLKMNCGTALILGLSAMLFPALSNMVMAIYYGFHVIYLFIPFVILFFMFFERGKLFVAGLIFLFSLTLKETVAVFWFGTALMLFIQGRHRRFAGGMVLTSLIYFLLIAKVVMPALSPAANYDLLYRYAHLGDSFTSIALSPVLRPGIFFGTLFQINNLYLLLLLIIPMCALVCSRPLLLLGAMPLLVFVCLQKNRELQTIALWYPSAALALLMANSVIAAGKVKTSNLWYKSLLADFEVKIFRRKLRFAALCTALVMSSMSYYFFGLSIMGKNSAIPLLSAPDCSADRAKICSVLPPGKSLNATPRIGGWFVLRNRVYQVNNAPQEYALFDLNDPLAVNTVGEELRRKILESGRYRVLMNHKSNGHQYLLFHREENIPKLKIPFVQIPEQKWRKLGRIMPVRDNNFTVRGALVSKNQAIFFIRLNHRVNYDAAFNIQFGNERETFIERVVFGNGLFPAYNAKPGDVFPIRINIPAKVHPVTRVTIESIKFGVIKL